MAFPTFAVCVFVANGALTFYTVFESKRRQKFIPIIPPLHNSSLDFTETVGLLYFNKSDHSNLAEK